MAVYRDCQATTLTRNGLKRGTLEPMHPRSLVNARLPIGFTARLAGAAVVLALSVTGIHSLAQAQAPPPAARTAIDVTRLGPQVGEQVPDFSLADQNGTVWTRNSILGPKGAMLVFIRSADW